MIDLYQAFMFANISVGIINIFLTKQYFYICYINFLVFIVRYMSDHGHHAPSHAPKASSNSGGGGNDPLAE